MSTIPPVEKLLKLAEKEEKRQAQMWKRLGVELPEDRVEDGDVPDDRS